MAKANKRQALGRGLSALLDDSVSLTPSNESVVGNVVELTLDQIEVNPFQPRTNFPHPNWSVGEHLHRLGHTRRRDQEQG